MYKPDARVRLLNARRLNRLARRLRAMPEARAFRYVRQFIAIEPHAGLPLANRTIRSKAYVEQLFVEGLRRSGPGSIQLWIKLLWRRLGPDRTVSLIRSEAAAAPDVGRWAAYWLPAELNMADPATAAAVRQLRADFPAAEPVAVKLEAV